MSPTIRGVLLIDINWDEGYQFAYLCLTIWYEFKPQLRAYVTVWYVSEYVVSYDLLILRAVVAKSSTGLKNLTRN